MKTNALLKIVVDFRKNLFQFKLTLIVLSLAPYVMNTIGGGLTS
jgi:hypothetical protein